MKVEAQDSLGEATLRQELEVIVQALKAVRSPIGGQS